MTRSDDLPVIGRLPGHLHEPLRRHLGEPVVLTGAAGLPLAVMVAAVTWDRWERENRPSEEQP